MPSGGIPRGSGRRGRTRLTGRRPHTARARTVRERAAGREGRARADWGRLGAGPGVTSPARFGQSAARVGLLKVQGSLSVSRRTKKAGGGAGRKVAGGHAWRPRPSLPLAAPSAHRCGGCYGPRWPGGAAPKRRGLGEALAKRGRARPARLSPESRCGRGGRSTWWVEVGLLPPLRLRFLWLGLELCPLSWSPVFLSTVVMISILLMRRLSL